MIRCGEYAMENRLHGPFGGRIFWDGNEVGTPQKHVGAPPGATRRLYTSNLKSHELSDRRHVQELLAYGKAKHPWQVGLSYLPPFDASNPA